MSDSDCLQIPILTTVQSIYVEYPRVLRIENLKQFEPLRLRSTQVQ